MKDKKLCNICLLCGHEAVHECYKTHPKDVEEVFLSNILTEEEMRVGSAKDGKR